MSSAFGWLIWRPGWSLSRMDGWLLRVSRRARRLAIRAAYFVPLEGSAGACAGIFCGWVAWAGIAAPGGIGIWMVTDGMIKLLPRSETTTPNFSSPSAIVFSRSVYTVGRCEVVLGFPLGLSEKRVSCR